MKKQITIKLMIFAAVLCGISGVAAANQQQTTLEQIEQLRNIEEQIAKEQQLIESRYDQQIAILLECAENRAKKLDSSYRMLWIKYYDMIKDAPAKDNYVLTARIWPRAGLAARNINILREKMVESYSLYNAWTFLLSENARDFVAHIANNSNYGDSTCILRSQAREVLTIMTNLQAQLERHRQYRQRALDNLAQRENTLKQNILAEAVSVQPAAKGLVSATAYADGNWLAMVGDKVVQEGEAIGDIEILKIDAKQVQFKKRSQVWTQKLGENQEGLWQ